MKILRLPEIIGRTKLCRSILYERINNKTWPVPIKLSSRGICWLESEIVELTEAMVAGASEEGIKKLVISLENKRNKYMPEAAKAA